MIIFLILGTVLLLIFLNAGLNYSNEVYIAAQIRPILQGDNLDSWTKLYEANAILYNHSIAGSNTIEHITWTQYSELTGNAEWIDNPAYREILDA